MRIAALSLFSVLFVCLSTAASAGEFPDDWFFGRRSAKLIGLEGKPAPELQLRDWHGEETTLEDNCGKIVVLDFWATWCGPCMAAVPKNIELVDKYGDDIALVGIHDSRRGHERMVASAKSKKMNYPVAIDNAGQTVAAYGLSFWPTYVVIDAEGVVRAAGLKPGSVGKVVEALLTGADPADIEKAAAAAAPVLKKPVTKRAGQKTVPAANINDERGIPVKWLEGNAGQRARLNALHDAPLPALASDTWLNTEPLQLDELKGKVVMLDFWGTWCPPCIASIPKMNQLHDKYSKDGLVIIGVCHPRNVDRMSSVAEQKGIKYALCADASGQITNNYKVNGFPDYYFIDRTGKLRIADCSNSTIEAAIQKLIAE